MQRIPLAADMVAAVAAAGLIADPSVYYADGDLVLPDQLADPVRAWISSAGSGAVADLRKTALAVRIRAEFEHRIALLLQGKGESILRWGLSLQNKAFRGLALTDAEQADVTMLVAIDDWEGRMIETREALIELADATFADDAHWPAPPAGLTAAWLAGF